MGRATVPAQLTTGEHCGLPPGRQKGTHFWHVWPQALSSSTIGEPCVPAAAAGGLQGMAPPQSLNKRSPKASTVAWPGLPPRAAIRRAMITPWSDGWKIKPDSEQTCMMDGCERQSAAGQWRVRARVVLQQAEALGHVVAVVCRACPGGNMCRVCTCCEPPGRCCPGRLGREQSRR